MGSERVEFCVGPLLRDQLDRESELTGHSISAVCRAALLEYLENQALRREYRRKAIESSEDLRNFTGIGS